MNDTLALLRPEAAAIQLPDPPVRVLGIDLGTTNSTVAEIVWRPEDLGSTRARCLEIAQDTTAGTYTHFLVPSAVAILSNRTFVGEGAKRLQAEWVKLGLERDKTLFSECKNDIGAQRTYHRAAEGYRTPAEVSGHVLAFLRRAALEEDSTPIKRTVVTVPASFQATQRRDTVRAAELAGISLSGGDLLDEPVAAFLDYLVQNPQGVGQQKEQPQNLVVFDFGGGTCDVAIFRLDQRTEKSGLSISPLAVSRYHRLGGGDIDRAIVHEILVPQILEQNGLSAFDLSFDDRKNFIEPGFLGVAEALKTGLCSEIARLDSFSQFKDSDKTQVIKRQPGLHMCQLKERTLQLQSPSLTAAQFEKLLAPFLDQDFLYARETEYRLTCSIFAPVQDSLDRGGLTPDTVDLCLLVGGSSLIPQVAWAVQQYFSKAKILVQPDREATQVAIARGAAYHALALALYGRSILQSVAYESVSIRTSGGYHELIPRGQSLPYPAPGEWAETSNLAVPETSMVEAVDLRVEIVAGAEHRPLFRSLWSISAPVSRGDKLRLEYRVDENQVFEFRLTLADASDAIPFSQRIENPLTNVINPQAVRLKIQQAEEDLRTNKVPAAQIPAKVVEIARDYSELHQTDKAIDYLHRALRMKNKPDAEILNLLGIYHGQRGDHARQEKFYRECADQFPHFPGPLFNLALAQQQRGKLAEAEKTVVEYLDRRTDGPGHTLAAEIANGLDKLRARTASLKKALAAFEEPRAMSDWELGWFVTAAKLAKDTEKLAAATAEQSRRRAGKNASDNLGGELPLDTGALTT